MFGLEGIGNMLGGALGGLFNQGGQGAEGADGCHHHHHHHHHQNNTDQAAQDFQKAGQEFGDAKQDFSQGNIRGGIQELTEANQYLQDGLNQLSGGQDGFNQLSGGRGWI
jgi:hypothetical protein